MTDAGTGIDAADLPRLTERFYRADKARSRRLGGTGLGLAIVKHIVNRHRGRLVASSRAGQRQPVHGVPARGRRPACLISHCHKISGAGRRRHNNVTIMQ